MIRHGRTKGNAEHRYIGKTEEFVTTEGMEELQSQKKKYPPIELLFESPKKRCRMTGDILYPNIEVIEIPEFTEMDFGEFEGKNYEELKGNDAYQKWIDSGGALPFPNGESRDEYVKRVRKGVMRLWAILKREEKKRPNTIGIIAHGGTIMALLSEFAGGSYFEYQVKNGAGYVFELIEKENHFSIQNIQKIE